MCLVYLWYKGEGSASVLGVQGIKGLSRILSPIYSIYSICIWVRPCPVG